MEAIELVKYRGARSILATLLKFPERQFSISELAREAGVSFSSTWRLVKKWEMAGLVETGKIGTSITVKLHKSEYLDSVSSILRISASPQAFTADALREILSKEAKIKEAYLFGSVARGEEKLTSDIDVALLAEKGYDANALVFDVYRKYGTKIVPLLFKSRKELNDFLKNKKAGRLK